MKRFNLLALLVLVVAVVLVGCFKEELEPNQTDVTLQESLTASDDEARVISYALNAIEDQYIVVYKSDASASTRARAASNYEDRQLAMNDEAGLTLKKANISSDKVNHVYGTAITGFAAKLTSNELSALKRDKEIDYIEQDQTFTVSMGGPPGGGGGGGGGQTTPYGITRVGGSLDGAGMRAWIIDSGIDLDHPDLNVNVGLSASFLGGNQSDNPDDQNGHGTHVAGTVAAIDNSEGVIGVAAGAEVVSVRVLNRRGSGSNSGVIAGVNYVAANAANSDAANMSLGGGISSALDAAVVAASSSCPFALAAGNESQHANNSSPARANGPNIYTVSAMNSSDNWASYSNYGNPPVDFCAPGSGVNSTWKSGGYNTISGTSMAAPHVCGLLLFGNVSSDGNVNGDPDGNADPIAHR